MTRASLRILTVGEKSVRHLQRVQPTRQRDFPRSEVDLVQLIEHLREALLGLAERQIPGDSLPCFCVQHEAGSGVHDEWCEIARAAVAEVGDISPV